MTDEVKSLIVSRRRVFWLAGAVIAAPASFLATSGARAQSDQAPAAAPTAPKKTTKTKTKKAKPAKATDPANSPPAAPK
jgi:hypothetical protein